MTFPAFSIGAAARRPLLLLTRANAPRFAAAAGQDPPAPPSQPARPRLSDQPKIVARHELGHLISFIANGDKKLAISLKSDEVLKGSVTPEKRPLTARNYWNHVVSCIAGLIFTCNNRLYECLKDKNESAPLLCTAGNDIRLMRKFLEKGCKAGLFTLTDIDLSPLPLERYIDIVKGSLSGKEDIAFINRYVEDLTATVKHPIIQMAAKTAGDLFNAIPPETLEAMTAECVAKRRISQDEMPAFIERHLPLRLRAKLKLIMRRSETEALRQLAPPSASIPPKNL
ncbi:MAG: hypothetical protein IPK79_12535 [Vampirovibrionales bacterium]|nr:hypothetical protein [Vampirovibrionales bacterium]